MKKIILSIEGLSFKYDDQTVLEDVTIQVEEGEFIGIFGPNGGGKTTLLKLMMGMLRPEKGTIKLLGASPKQVRHKIGYVPQTLHCDKDFPISVFDVVMMGTLSKLPWWGGYTKELKQKAIIALEQVGLAQLKKQSFGTLSGGQAQRALIARAIVDSPKILLLDEPTASIDPQAEVEILQLLLNLNKTMTIIMITHDLQVIIDKSKRLFCVDRKVSAMRTKEVCEHFALGLYHTPLTSKDHFNF